MPVDNCIITENLTLYKEDLFFMLCSDLKQDESISKELRCKIERCEGLMYYYMQLEKHKGEENLTTDSISNTDFG